MEELRDDPYYIMDNRPKTSNHGKHDSLDIESIPVVRLVDLPPPSSGELLLSFLTPEQVYYNWLRCSVSASTDTLTFNSQPLPSHTLSSAPSLLHCRSRRGDATWFFEASLTVRKQGGLDIFYASSFRFTRYCTFLAFPAIRSQ